MTVHKIYVDSRAAKEGDAGDFVWAPDRPLSVGKCRAFIDSVHLPVTWGTITDYNKYFYVAEELPFLTVLATASRVYLRETIGGVTGDRIVLIPPAIYDGLNLAVALSTALGANYSVSHTAVAGTLGTLTTTTTNDSFTVLSRATLLRDGAFGGSPLIKSSLQDASDILGTTLVDSSSLLTLGLGLGYRRVELSKGTYTFDSLALELQTQLNTGSNLATYSVGTNSTTGRLSLTNTNTLKFHVYPSQYLDRNPFSFPGFTAPFHHSDAVTGFTGAAVIGGNSVVAASHVNTMAYHTLFINSSLGTHSDTIGPVGQSTIARKVVIDGPQGSFVHDFHSTPFDYLALDKQSITSIRFRVTDWRGSPVDMSPWSLSIVFVPEAEF